MPSVSSLRAYLLRSLQLTIAALFASSCSLAPVVSESPGHLSAGHSEAQSAPEVSATPAPTEPQRAVVDDAVVEETYTVVVKNVPVVDLLFSLARDANLELDLQASSKTTVTMNAVDRPLHEILSRIASQAQLRIQRRGSNLIIQTDSRYWHNYQVNYVNITRNSEGEVGVATQIATSGGSVGEQSAAGADEQGNLSKTTVKNKSDNDFWLALDRGLNAVIRSDGANDTAAEAKSVVVNPMSGIVTVFGNQAEQVRVQDYLDSVLQNSRRQVLIEMTIVEVELSDDYQAGVDWQRLSANSGAGSNGPSAQANLLGARLGVPPFVSLGYNDVDADGSSISANVRLLQQFGDTKVLSSPKIMALNNQTALLKVVNESVYFTVEVDVREATLDIPERRTFTSELHTVPVGLVLSVTPQISSGGMVSLNIRPTISRITGFAVDPAPRLSGADFDNLVPQIQVREIESLLQVANGNTVILGGLMQNERESQKDGIPGLSRIPKVGKLFSFSSDKVSKTELVIFLKPTVIETNTAATQGQRLGDYYDSSQMQSESTAVEYR